VTTTKLVHHLKTTEKCPYGKQVEDASGLNHPQQPVNLLWRQDVEGGMLFYLLKEKQSLGQFASLTIGLRPIGPTPRRECWNNGILEYGVLGKWVVVKLLSTGIK